MTSFNNREKRGSQLDGEQDTFYTCVPTWTPPARLGFFLNGLTSSSSINPAIPVGALERPCPVLQTIWDYCYGNLHYPEKKNQKNQPKQTNRNTVGGQEHVARLGIRIIPQRRHGES